MATSLRNLFGTVVHDVPEGTTPVELRSAFGTVVHDVPEGTTPIELRSTFGTVVHDVPEGTTPIELRSTFGTVVHSAPFSVFAADITGALGVSAMFSASVSGEQRSPPRTYPETGFQWEFTSVPSGSQLAKVPPLPDNSSAGGWTDMSDNTTLFHFNEDLSWIDATTLNGATGSSALTNTADWVGTLTSGSDPRILTSSLGDYRGVEFFGNNKLVTTLTASQLGIDGAYSKTIMMWAKISEDTSNDDKYLFSVGTDTDHGMVALQKPNKNAFTSNPDQGNLQQFKSYTGFDNSSHETFWVANTDQWRHWAVTYESGSTELVWYVDGEVVMVDPCYDSFSVPPTYSQLNTGDTAVHIGGFEDDGTGNTNSMVSSSISEFAIFSSSLPQSQIREIYNKQKATGFYQDTWDQFPDNEDLTQWVDMSDNTLLYHLDEKALSGTSDGAYQLPDNQASGSIVNMSGNTGLWHLDEMNVIPPSSTQIGSVGLLDSWGDGWHGANWVSVLVNSMVVVSSATLAGGGGPEWYDFTAVDGDSIEVIYTSNGCNSPSWGSECSFVINSGSAGGGATFYTSGLCPIGVPFAGTANGFSSGTIPAVEQVLDSSGNGFTGDPNGASASVGFTLFSGSTEFTGAMDFVSSFSQDIDFSTATATGLGINGNNSRTTMLWASASVWANNMNLFAMGEYSANQDWSLLTRTDGLSLNVQGSDVDWAGMSSVEKNNWIHIACVWDGSNLRLYFNGTERATSTPGVLNTSDVNSLRLGNGYGSGAPWNGLIKEFAMFNEALPASEIEKIFINQNLNATDNRAIQDSSGHGNYGYSVLDYTSSINGPFPGSTAWSGSGTNIIKLGDLPITGSGGLSFSTWLKPDQAVLNSGTSGSFYLFHFTNGSNQNISLRKYWSATYKYSEPRVYFDIGSDAVSSLGMLNSPTGSVIGGVPTEAQWINWVATADGAGGMSLYKNGELINSSSGGSAIPTAIRDDNYIGINQAQDANQRFRGELSEFAMWERELSAYEVQKMYQHQYSGSSVYNSYGVDVYSNSASFLPDVDGDYTVKYTAFGSMATGSATGSMGSPSPVVSSMLKLYLNITEIAWIYQDDGSGGGGGGGGGGSTSSILPQTSGGPRIGSGFVINNYKAVSSERIRRVEQVPFKLGLRDKLGLRVAAVTGSTPTPTPTGDNFKVYGNVTEIAWIYKE